MPGADPSFPHRDASKPLRRSGRRRRRRNVTRRWPRRCTRRGWRDSSARRSATSLSTLERRGCERHSGHAEHHVSLLSVQRWVPNRITGFAVLPTPERRKPNPLRSAASSSANMMVAALLYFGGVFIMAWHNWSWKFAAATEGRGLSGRAQRTGRMDEKQPGKTTPKKKKKRKAYINDYVLRVIRDHSNILIPQAILTRNITKSLPLPFLMALQPLETHLPCDSLLVTNCGCGYFASVHMSSEATPAHRLDRFRQRIVKAAGFPSPGSEFHWSPAPRPRRVPAAMHLCESSQRQWPSRPCILAYTSTFCLPVEVL